MHAHRDPQRTDQDRQVAGPRARPDATGLTALHRAVGNAAFTNLVAGASTSARSVQRVESVPEQPQAALTRSLIGAADAGRGTVKRIQEELLRRLTAGPVFSDAELAVIRACPQPWLDSVGIGTYASADAYPSAETRYTTWLKQSPGRRLLIATLAFIKHRDKVPDSLERKSPAFTLGRALRIRHPVGLSQEEVATLVAERDGQIREAFVDTLVPDHRREGMAGSPEERKVDRARDLLTRVFLILQNGLKVHEQDTHIDYREGDVARALAHGGRVTIRIPQLGSGDNPAALPHWLGLTDEKGVRTSQWTERGLFGTHRVDIGKNVDGVPGTGSFKERGELSASVKNTANDAMGLMGLPADRARMFRLNVAADGWGRDDFNGDVITPDGGHGHLFIGFQPPTATRDGALQVGLETTGPGGRSPVGYKHGPFSSEATANPESSVYAHKQDRLGDGKLSTNRRLVQLQELSTPTGGWLDFLQRVRSTWEAKLAQAEREDQVRDLYQQLVGPRREEFGPAGM